MQEHLTEGALTYYVFHGPSRTEDPEELAKYDVIITTYSTVLSDTTGKSTKRGSSPLTQMNFFRVVLDEAHAIREQNAAQSQAIFRLEAQRRWSVTGTPIQNRLDDLGSVTRFLRLYPFNERAQFAAHIIAPFKSESPQAVTTLRVLVDSFTLRRVKDRISLPPRHDQAVSLTFSDQEKKLHEFFRKESNVMMNVIAGQTQEKISGKMYHLVLKAMMILRQISAHGKELLDPEDRERFRGLSANDAIDLEEMDNNSNVAADKKAYEMLTLMKESSADVCAKCTAVIPLQGPDDSPGDKNALVAAMFPCYDILCADCFSKVRRVFEDNAGKPTQLKCLFCKGIIPPVYTAITTAGFEQYQSTQLAAKQSRKQAKVLGQYEGPHTKTKALISRLLETAEESKQQEAQPPIKSVVFSGWTSHLDLIEIALEENGLRGFTRLDGTMSLKQRNAALDAFKDDDNITILLATLGAGGVGLNLTAASKVYVMEPQYNPAAVAQAVDRIHRLGQTREVTTVQFVMKDSIEEKISELAKRKQQLADMSLNRSKADRREMQVERLREYRSLFK
jgi:SNF2 family DNA or RNA helicase